MGDPQENIDSLFALLFVLDLPVSTFKELQGRPPRIFQATRSREDFLQFPLATGSKITSLSVPFSIDPDHGPSKWRSYPVQPSACGCSLLTPSNCPRLAMVIGTVSMSRPSALVYFYSMLEKDTRGLLGGSDSGGNRQSGVNL